MLDEEGNSPILSHLSLVGVSDRQDRRSRGGITRLEYIKMIPLARKGHHYWQAMDVRIKNRDKPLN